MKKIILLLIEFFLISNLVNSQVRVQADGSLQGNQSGAIRINTGNGYVDIGPKNASFCHFYTDRSSYFFNKDITLGSGIIRPHTNKDFSIFFPYAGYPAFVMKYSTGYVGISYYNPQKTLDVGGDIRATGVVTWSDLKIKDDIEDITPDEINNLYKLNAKRYKLDTNFFHINQREQNREHYGFIATELRDLYPDLVHEDDSGYLSINYSELIPILVEAIKVQNEMILKLEEKIKDKDEKNSKEPIIEDDTKAMLGKNRPNPFNENTFIEYYLPSNVQSAILYIYDLQGKQLRSIQINERNFGQVTLHGSELQPGIYNYSLIADGQIIGIEKMVLTK